jgi:hypothetical protein
LGKYGNYLELRVIVHYKCKKVHTFYLKQILSTGAEKVFTKESHQNIFLGFFNLCLTVLNTCYEASGNPGATAVSSSELLLYCKQ